MAGSTWSWLAGSGSGTSSSNWTLVGVGTNGVPQAGDTAIVTGGTVQYGVDTQFASNTIDLGATSGTADLAFTGDTSVSFALPTLDNASIIQTAVPGNTSSAEISELDISGSFVNRGSILANGPGSSTLTVNEGSAVINTTTVPASFLDYGLVQVSSGNSLKVSGGGLTVDGGTGSTGTLSVSGSGAIAGAVTIGNAGTGELDVLNGGSLSVGSNNSIYVGTSAGSDGLIKVSGAGAALVVQFPGFGMELGVSGSAGLDVESGGSVYGNILYAGVNSGASASILVSGGTLSDSSVLGLGVGGTASLTIQNGGSVSAGESTEIGLIAGSSGTVDVTGTLSALSGSQMILGDGSNGLLNVQSHAAVTFATVEFGTSSGGQGIATISSGGQVQASAMTITAGHAEVTDAGSGLSTGQFIVGDTGTGSLSVQNDATVVTNPGSSVSVAAVIGNQSGASNSSVTVTGAGSDWQVGGTLEVGNAASGQLSVGGGGTVTAASLEAGAQSGSSGVITVSGSNSSLGVTGSVMIGGSGAGELSVLSGANVTIGGDLNAGTTSGGSGNIDIEDPGGTVTVNGNLTLGSAGVGALTVGLNSTLVVKGVLTNGALGAVNQYGLIDPAGLDNTNPYAIYSSQTLVYDAYVVNQSQITLKPGVALTLETPQVTNGGGADGTFSIGTGSAALTLDGDIFSGQTISFTDTTGSLTIGYDNLGTIETPASGTGPFTSETNPNYGQMLIGHFSGVINGYQNGDTIRVDTTQAASFVQNGSIVEVMSNGNSIGALTFTSSTAASAAVTNSALVDQVVTPPPPCFAAGTRIRTARGEVAVEALREGELVWSVLGGRYEPVRWIGQRSVNCRAHPQPEKVWPVVVSAGAFGPGLPARALVLSPDHAVYVNEGLIPVKLLVNGTSIRQVPVDSVSYYHVELPAHDVVLAEALAVESYLDVDDRTSFSNGGGAVALHPDFTAHRWELRWEAEACAPFYVVGPQVAAARAMVAAAAQAFRWRMAGATGTIR